jgi:hypothetical protein
MPSQAHQTTIVYPEIDSGDAKLGAFRSRARPGNAHLTAAPALRETIAYFNWAGLAETGPPEPPYRLASSSRSALTLQQAVAQAPVLARLGELAAESNARLAVILPALPPALRPLIRCGAPDCEAWTLLVPHNAAAAKLRQLTPTLTAALAAAGHPVASIRIKVARPQP